MSSSNKPVRAPALIHRNPDCSLCGEETELVDDYFQCGECGFYWPINGVHDELGTPCDEDTPICGNRVRPFIDYRGPVALSQKTREQVYTCVLEAGHESQWCRGVDDDEKWPQDHSWVSTRTGG